MINRVPSLALVLALASASTTALAQNYSATASAVGTITYNTTAGNASTTYMANQPAGGTVTASSQASAPQLSSAKIEVTFNVTVVDNVAPATPQGYTQASDDASGHSSSTGSASAYAESGFIYSPWLSLIYNIGTNGNPYHMVVTYPTNAPPNNWYADFTGATTLHVTAEAYNYSNASYTGTASAYSDSQTMLTVK